MSVVEYNEEIAQWGAGTKRKLKLKVLQMVAHNGAGAKQQKVNVKKYMGEASRIDFDFPYYMVFVHKGAGRGYGGNKTGSFSKFTANYKGIGGVWSKHKTNSGSMGKMGTGKRQAKPWFNPVLEEQFPALAQLIANYHGEKVVLQLQKILIK